MHVALESPDQPEVISLIAELDAYQDTLYPPESRHSLDLTSLKQPNVVFVVARNTSGQAIGCGAVVVNAEYGELKRMYVHPHSRGGASQGRSLPFWSPRPSRLAANYLDSKPGPASPKHWVFMQAVATNAEVPLGNTRTIHSVCSCRSESTPNPLQGLPLFGKLYLYSSSKVSVLIRG